MASRRFAQPEIPYRLQLEGKTNPVLSSVSELLNVAL
jgi:hypothetical protein